MLTNKRERARQQRAALWATRDNVQRHALSMSMPWLAFVNIAFALMIFFRNFIFTYFDKRLLTHRAVIPYIEAALIAVIIISAILVIIALTPRLAQGRYTLNIITGLLLALSLALALALRAKGLKNTSWAEVCRTTFLLPMALPVASLALLWKVLFAQNGLVNGTFGTHCDFMGTDAAF